MKFSIELLVDLNCLQSIIIENSFKHYWEHFKNNFQYNSVLQNSV